MKIFITLFLIFTCSVSFAQVIPTEAPATPPTKQAAKSHTQKKQLVQLPATSVIKILPDADCTIYIDNEKKGKVIAGNFLKIPLGAGDYVIKAVGTNPADVLSQNYTVETVGRETILNIKLNDVVNARLQKEEYVKQVDAEKKKYRQVAGAIPMEFVQGGSFDMGTNDGPKDATPVHHVTISSFYIGKHEVTQAQWQAVMGNNPSDHINCNDCPVESVNWDDVQHIIEKLNQKTGYHYRLPTEAEWEYAARGGNISKGYTYSGSNDITTVGWFKDNSGYKTQPVGQKQGNELGIYDMTGNVSEWCQDWYGVTYYSSSPQQDPLGLSIGSRHVCRGGAWLNEASYCSVYFRNKAYPAFGFNYLGFRLAMSP